MRSIWMRPILSDVHGRSACLSLVTRMYCGKTAGPIEMPFGMWGGASHSNHVLDVGPDNLREWVILGNFIPLKSIAIA